MAAKPKYVGFLAPPDLAEAFAAVAASNERTLSAELRRLMREAVDGNARLRRASDSKRAIGSPIDGEA